MAKFNSKWTVDPENKSVTVDDPSLGEVVLLVVGTIFAAIFTAITSADSSDTKESGKRGRRKS